MATAPSELGRRSSERRPRWVIALAATTLVAVAGFALAVHQFVLKYLYDQSSYTRTAGGLLFILLGAAGIFLPVALRRNRLRFLSLRPSRQWLVAAGVPLAHMLVLAGCLEAALRSRTVLLPRPFTPTAVVQYRPGDSRVEFQGGWRASVGPAGYNGADVLPDGTEEFSSHLAQGFSRGALEGPETVTIVGRARREDDGPVRIVLDVDAREAIRFAVENLGDVRVLRDGRPLTESHPQSGTFQVTITGRPKLLDQ